MTQGSARRWGPLFGARAQDWSETWEGTHGWGLPVYKHVLERAHIGDGTRVLDCGCGAGRFLRLAADRGAQVAGIDAAGELIVIARQRTPSGDFREGDLEALPWANDEFDAVTGFSAFQFADDKIKALAEAGRVSRGPVAVVVPTRLAESGIAAVFKPLLPLFPAGAVEGFARSGMFALSDPRTLGAVLARADLEVHEDEDVDCQVTFEDIDTAVRAFMGAGPTALAIRHSGEAQIADTVREALATFADSAGQVTLPAWYRVVYAGRRRSSAAIGN